MAQLAVSVAGAAIGNALLPGVGGMVAGAITGSLLYMTQSAPANTGARVKEPDVQLASYGTPVPSTYGSDRVSGAVMWQGRPIKGTRSSGGGKGKPKVTQDTYTQSFAIAINARIVKAVRRIWADKKIIYDARDGATAEARAESTRWREYWKLYKGDDDQLPDPTIEAEDGIGNVPAFRGTAYVMFTAFPLEGWGNRIPSFSFEIETERDEVLGGVDQTAVREPLRIYPWAATDRIRVRHWFGPNEFRPWNNLALPAGSNFEEIAAAQASFMANDGTIGFLSEQSQTSIKPMPGYWHTSTNPLMAVEPGGANVYDDPQYVYVRTMAYMPESEVQVDRHPYAMDIGARTKYYIKNNPGGLNIIGWADRLVYRDRWIGSNEPPPPGFAPTPYAQLFLGSTPDGRAIVSTAWMSAVYTVRTERIPWHPPKTCRSAFEARANDPCNAPERAIELPEDPTWCLTCEGGLIPNRVWTTVTGTAKQLAAVEYRDGRLYQNGLGPVLVPSDADYDNAAFWAAARDAAILDGTLKPDVESPVLVTSWAESGGGLADAWGVPPPTTTTLTLGQVVQEICLETGKLTAGQIDVSELTDVVIGYTRPRRMSARAALEPLLRAYLVGVVESDGKIAFRKLSRSVSRSIPAEDLGAGIGQAEAVRMKTTRAQEDELPVELVLSYRAVSLDYQTGVQRAQRRATVNGQRAAVEIPVVMTDDYARQLADALLYMEHASRTRAEFSVLRGYAAIEPTDVIEVDDGNP